MVLADSNVWLALAFPKHEFHPAVETWFTRQKARDTVFFCRATQQSFLRLLTTSAVFAPHGLPALSNKSAWSVYEGLFADERISWTKEPGGVDSQWKKLAGNSKPSPKLGMDAYLAAVSGRIPNTLATFGRSSPRTASSATALPRRKAAFGSTCARMRRSPPRAARSQSSKGSRARANWSSASSARTPTR